MNRIVIFLFALCSLTVQAQTDRDFWFVAPEVTTSHYDNVFYPEFNKTYRGGEPVFLRISTQNKPSTIIVTQPANPAFDTIKATIPANTLYSINLTDLGRQAMVENVYGTDGKGKRGIHIESTELVTAYYEVFTKNNTDLFALKGKNALGTDFYTPFQNISYNHVFTVKAYHSANIVATKDNTVITITPTKDVQGYSANSTFTITLQKGETYSLCPKNFDNTAAQHMSGTRISSNYPVAVTLSDDSGQLSPNGCYDLMGDQLIPTSIIGTEYIAIRGQLSMSGRTAGYSGETVYITATQAGTKLYINGGWVKTFAAAGDTYMHEFKTTDSYLFIKADAPVYAAHVSGFGCEQGYAVLPPTNKCTGSTQVAFSRSTTEGFFLNIMVRKNAYDGFLLNGNPILTNLSDWTSIPYDPNWLIARVNYTSTAIIPNLKQSFLINTKDIFHLGIINGGTSTGCRFGYFSDFNELKIDAITVKTSTGNIRVCYGEPVRLEAYGGTNFRWTPGMFMDDSLSQFPTVRPYTTTKYTVSVSGACNMVGTDDVTVEVAPKITTFFKVDTATACAPHTFALTNLSTGVTDGYKWLYDDGTASSTSSAKVIYHSYSNKTDSAVQHTITLVGKNLESCRDTMKRIVTLLPEINSAFKLSDTIKCSPLVPVFTNNSSGARGLVPYLWEFGDGASSTDSLPKHTFENKTKKDTSYNIRLITQNQFYCSDTSYQNVIVHPYIKADFQFSPDESCNPYNMTIKNSSVGVDSYKWTFGDGTTGTNSTTSFTHLYNNTTSASKNYSIQAAVANIQGCKDTMTRNVTVFPTIKASFTASKTIGCDSLVVVFTNASIGGASYKWDFGDGSSDVAPSPTHIYRNLGATSITYRAKLFVLASNNVCSDTMSVAITVHPYIQASFTVTPSESCNPYNATIVNKSVGVNTYQWTFGDGTSGASSLASFNHLYNNTSTTVQTYTIKLSASNTAGCTVSQSRNIKVYPTISASFITSKTIGCDSSEIVFSNKSVGATNYYWTFGDGGSDVSASPKHVFRNLSTTPKTFIVKLFAQSSNLLCSDSTSVSITINPYIKASFSFDAPAACSPYNAQITNTSVNVKTYLWNYGDNSTTSNTSVTTHNHIYTNTSANPITRILKLKVTSTEGCTDSMQKNITTYPLVSSRFALQGGCSPVTIKNFNNSSVNATIFEWAFGDGATATVQQPQHTFTNLSNTADVNYKIVLKAASIYGCSDTHDTTIKIMARPKANFDFGTTTGCAPYNFVINHKSIGQSAVSWDFGDGTSRTTNKDTLIHTYNNSSRVDKNFTVSLIASNSSSCKDTMKRSIVVYPAVTSEFAIVGGCSPLKISDFKNTSVGAATYLWTIGSSVTMGDQNPTFIFRNYSNTKDTVVTISLKTTSYTGCTKTSSQSITIHPKPLAQFSLGASTGCSPYVQTINNTTVGASALAWDFGTGEAISNTTAASFSHNYTNNSRVTLSYPLTLIAETAYGCSDTMQRNVVVEPKVVAEFSTISGCEPHVVTNFNNTSVGASLYNWSFGDGISSPDKNPSHTFRNVNQTKDTTYKIKLVVTSAHACKDSADTVIAVYHKPTANFNILNPTGCSAWLDTVVNQSVGYDSLSWDFGDGKALSYSKQATFTYQYQNTSGVNKDFDLTLIAVTNKGCSDTTIRQTTVYSAVTANFSIQSGCHPLVVSNFKNTTIGAAFYNWDFGDGNSSNAQNPTHTYTNFSNTATAQYKIKLTAQSTKGCINQKDTTITIYPQPLAKFALQDEVGCAPRKVTVLNQNIGADSIRWNYGDSSPITINKTSKHTHLYTNTSGKTIQDTVTMYVFNSYKCSDTTAAYTTIHSSVIAKFAATSGCQPHSIGSFKNTSSSFAKNNFWNFGDGITANVRDTSHTFTNFSNTNDVNFSIRLITETAEGCRDTADTVITVYHLPLAKFQLTDQVECSPRTVSIANQTIGADSLVWDYGDASALSNSKLAAQKYNYDNISGVTQNYTTTLRAFTRYGCSDTATGQSTIWSAVKAKFSVNSACHPLRISDFKNTSYPNNINTWAWTFGDGSSSSAKSPDYTFNNVDNVTDKQFKIRLRVASPEGCRDSLDTVITAYHRPKAVFTVDNTPGCSPYTVKFTNTSIGASNITWQWGDTSKSELSIAGTLSHLYRWRATDMKNFEVKAIATTANGCTDSVSHVAGIYPDISAQFSVAGGCEPLVVTDFKNTSIGVTKSYAWNFGDGSSTSDANPSHVFRNYDAVKDTSFTVSLRTLSKYGCSADTAITISIFHKPESDFTILNSPGCSPYPIKISHKSKGAAKYAWDFGDTSIDSTASASITHTYTLFADDLKIYPIQLITTSNKGCKDTVQRGATIYPSMSSEFISATEGCSPLQITIFNNSFGANKFEWDLGDHTTTVLTSNDSIQHSYYNPSFTRDTSFRVSLKSTSKYGCTAFSDTIITVFANPKSGFSVSPTKICSPDTITVKSETTGASSIYYTFDDGQDLFDSVNRTFKHPYRNTDSLYKIFTIRQITSNKHNCYDSTKREVRVDPDITSRFSVITEGCSPLQILAQNNSIGASKCEWNFGDKDVLTENSNKSVAHDYVNMSNTRDTSFILSLKTTSRYGCTAFSDTVITVFANPQAGFIVLNSPICSPDSIQIQSQTIGTTNIHWDFDDGLSTIDTVNKLFKHYYRHRDAAYRVFMIKQLVSNEHQCSDSIEHEARVNPDVSSEFIITLSGCSPLTTKPINNSFGAATYRWEFGDGTIRTEKEPDYTYYNYDPEKTTTYRVSLKTKSQYGCEANSDTVLAIYPNPKADFTVAKSEECSPFNTQITNLSVGASNYDWSFGEGESSVTDEKVFIHQYRNISDSVQTREIVLTASTPQKCSTTVKQRVAVYPQVTAAFTGNFSGCEPLIVSFTNTSKLSNNYTWSFGDDAKTEVKSPIHTYLDPDVTNKTYIAQLIAQSEYGCLDTAEETITVFPAPIADFDAQPRKQVFPKATVGKATIAITDKTNVGNWQYEWQFGDGELSTQVGHVTHDYLHWNESGANFRIMLRVTGTNGCTDTISQAVIVTSPLPEPHFSLSSDNGCPPYSIKFTNTSDYGNEVLWSFNDGTESHDMEPIHTFNKPGVYKVNMTSIGDGGTASIDTIITIHQTPIADFDIKSPRLYLPDDVLKTTNLSSFSTSYVWDFGDGTNSQEFEPEHLYNQEGVYNLKLKVITDKGCVDEKVIPNAVTVVAPCEIKLPNAFTPNTAAASPDGRFDGLEATNDLFYPAILEKGIDKYHLEVFNKWGELIWVTDRKDVGWDGYYQGELCQLDVYVWKLKATCLDGKKIEKVGDVTLIR